MNQSWEDSNQGSVNGDGDSRSASWKPSLLKFDDVKGDIDGYLKRFERLAKAYNWKENDWATIVSTRRTGKAEEVYNSLLDETALDYAALKKALLAWY